MQTVFIYVTLLLTGLVLQAQNTIEVTMTGFSNNNGKAMIAIYDSEDNFLESRLIGQLSKIENNKSTTIFKDIPDGDYAISVVHDEDNNGKLNMIMGFYPEEDTGSSNDAPARFGPPKWEDAKFEVKNGEVLKMNINL